MVLSGSCRSGAGPAIWSGTDRRMLEKALDLLSDRGRFFLVINSQHFGFKHALRDNCPVLTSEFLSEWASQEGVAHERFTVRPLIPLETYIRDGRATPELDCYVAFLNHVPLASLSNEIREKSVRIV